MKSMVMMMMVMMLAWKGVMGRPAPPHAEVAGPIEDAAWSAETHNMSLRLLIGAASLPQEIVPHPHPIPEVSRGVYRGVSIGFQRCLWRHLLAFENIGFPVKTPSAGMLVPFNGKL